MRPSVEVRSYNGAPTIFMDGKPKPAVAFWPFPTQDDKYTQEFTDRNVDIILFSYSAFSCWKGPSSYDFTAFDEFISRVVKIAPKAYFIPRILIIGEDSNWWVKANPGELRCKGDGSVWKKDRPGISRRVLRRILGGTFQVQRGAGFPSIASRRWREETGNFLRALIEHVNRSEYAGRIIGYQTESEQAGEWIYIGGPEIDYSIHNKMAFRDWLKNRYQSVKALRASWNDPDVTFESAELPSINERSSADAGNFRDPAKSRKKSTFISFKIGLWLIQSNISQGL